MKAIGFNFTRLSIEDIRDPKKSNESININTEINIISIKNIESSLLNTKEEILEAEFEYKVDYNPQFAKVDIKGRALILIEPKLSKEVLKEWKDKKMPEDFRIFLFNLILKKSTLRALHLEEELNLPLHLPMPSFKKGENKN